MKNAFKVSFSSAKFVAGFSIFIILILMAFIYPVINGGDALKSVSDRFTAPKSGLILGSDSFGRNEFLELFSGTSVSLLIGLIAGTIATVIGLVIGLTSGYIGGIVDDILMFLTNMFIVIPQFIILVLVSSSIPSKSFVVTAFVIAITGWPWTARAVRAQTTSLRDRDHVNLARMSGYSLPKIITFDIFPYVGSYVSMAFVLQVATGILNEAQLSMLGLGPQHTATLGLMLNWANNNEALIAGAWWAFVPPVLMIALATFSLNLMNTGLDQIYNPQIRG